jgi:hypothetical protein
MCDCVVCANTVENMLLLVNDGGFPTDKFTNHIVGRATCGLSRVLFALEVNHFRGTSPVRCSSVEALTARCDSRGKNSFSEFFDPC